MSEGWGVPEGSRTGHYFIEGWSLCRRWSPAPAELGTDPPERSCLACRSALGVRTAVGPVDRVQLDDS